MFGAPEPIGIPTPNVVVSCQIVRGSGRDRLVIDLQIGIVAEPFRMVYELAGRDVEFLAVKHRSVNEVHGPLSAQACHRLKVRFQVRIPMVRQLDEGLDRDECDLDPQRITECAVGVGKSEK